MSSQQFQVQQIDHVELFVPEQYEAAAWYRDVLGLKMMDNLTRWADEGGPLMISSDGGSTMLALFKGQAPGFRELLGFKRVAFRVDGAGFIQFLQRLKNYPVFDHQGQHAYALDPVDHDLSFSVYFCDPYGNRFEVTTYDYDFVKNHAP